MGRKWGGNGEGGAVLKSFYNCLSFCYAIVLEDFVEFLSVPCIKQYIGITLKWERTAVSQFL